MKIIKLKCNRILSYSRNFRLNYSVTKFYSSVLEDILNKKSFYMVDYHTSIDTGEVIEVNILSRRNCKNDLKLYAIYNGREVSINYHNYNQICCSKLVNDDGSIITKIMSAITTDYDYAFRLLSMMKAYHNEFDIVDNDR